MIACGECERTDAGVVRDAVRYLSDQVGWDYTDTTTYPDEDYAYTTTTTYINTTNYYSQHPYITPQPPPKWWKWYDIFRTWWDHPIRPTPVLCQPAIRRQQNRVNQLQRRRWKHKQWRQKL